jgi:hypothetical protein
MKTLLLATAAALTISIGSAYAENGEVGVAIGQQWRAISERPAVQVERSVASGRDAAVIPNRLAQQPTPAPLVHPSYGSG